MTVLPKRNILKVTAIAGAALASGLIVPSAFAAKPGKKEKKEPEKEAEVTPPEDLMRKHGVLDRLLLVYEAGLRKFAANEDFDPAIIANAAEIVRDFIENYHEKSEEEAVFPRFRNAGKMLPLVDTLLAQHQAGRRFEKKEHQQFGEDGFEMMVKRVAGLEQRIGIGDLAQFTPR